MKMLNFHYHRILGSAIKFLRSGFEIAISLYNKLGLKAEDLQRLGKNVALRAMVLAEFEHCKKQVYSLGPAMTKIFSQTKLGDIGDTEFRSPYFCLYIKITEGMKKSWELHGGDHVGWLPIEGMYVLYWQEIGEAALARIGEDPRTFSSMTILLTSKGPASHPYDDADFRFNVPLKGDLVESLEDVLCTNEWIKDMEGQKLPLVSTLVDMVRIAINLCTYLDSGKGDVNKTETFSEKQCKQWTSKVRATKPTKEHYEKYVTKLRKAESQCEVSEVGNDMEDKVVARAKERGVSVEEFLRTEHTVGGHKQRYWYGKKGSEEYTRKWVWKIGFIRCEGNGGEGTREHYEIE